MTDLAKTPPRWEPPLWGGLAFCCPSLSHEEVHPGASQGPPLAPARWWRHARGESRGQPLWRRLVAASALLQLGAAASAAGEPARWSERGGSGQPSAPGVAGQSDGQPAGKKRQKGTCRGRSCDSGVAHAVRELDLWLRRPSITYLSKERAEHRRCAAFHVCCPNRSCSVFLPRLFAHREVQGCCKSPKLLSVLLTFPPLEGSVPHSSVMVCFTFFISKQILNYCCSWQVSSLFGGCLRYCICVNRLYLLRILLGCVSGMSSEEFVKTPFQVINSFFNVC